MEGAYYMERLEKYLSSLKNEIEDEKKKIDEDQKKFSSLLNSFSQKAPSNSVINSLFNDDDEPTGFIFSQQEENRKMLAEQRKAEYNAFLQKKEAERLSKHRRSEDQRSISPKSILDAVDYERVLAKRKEEEAKFRNINLVDTNHSSEPYLKENIRNSNFLNGFDQGSVLTRSSGISYPAVDRINLPGPANSKVNQVQQSPLTDSKSIMDTLEREDPRMIEEIIEKHLREQKQQLLSQFEAELRKNNKMKEEIETLKASARNSPKRLNPLLEEFPKLGRTGGGGEPVKDSFGNLLIMRGLKRENNSENGTVMSFPSMQQKHARDRTALYREELQKQIDEKKRLEELEKAKARELEEKIAQRAEEQRLKLQQEYEQECKKTDKVKEKFSQQQERIRQLEEFQRKDAEARHKRHVEIRQPAEEKPVEIVYERSNSPPIPSVRSKVLLEKAAPVIKDVKPENVFSTLAEIRKKIREDEEKSKNGKKTSYEIMNRRTVQEVSDDDDDF